MNKIEKKRENMREYKRKQVKNAKMITCECGCTFKDYYIYIHKNQKVHKYYMLEKENQHLKEELESLKQTLKITGDI